MPPQFPRCPRCGSTIAPRAPQGLCPACLLGAALTSGDDDSPVFPYRIITLLGGDAAAVTYLAQTMSGAPKYIALKIVRSCADPDAVVSRFERWHRALADFRHSSAAPIFDAGRLSAGSIYLASEYVVGSPLEPLLHDPALDAAQRVEILRQLDGAVRAAHDRGLAHMRLEPSRIKIGTAAGLRATILGFGAALVVDGMPPDAELDRRALARIARDLGVAPPPPG